MLIERRQEDRLAPLRRGAVDEEPELGVSAVRELERRAGPDDQDASLRELVPLRRVALAHVDRQRPLEDDEDLLLNRVDVAASDGSGRVAEEVRPRARQALRKLGGEARVPLAPRLPVEVVRVEDRVGLHFGAVSLGAALREADNRSMVTGAVVGRETELAVLAEFLAAEGAWPRTLVLEGEAGAGKTTLWQTAVEDAQEDFRVLATRPLETEAKLAFAGVGDLLDGEHDSFGRLPEPQAHALRAALLLESPVAGTVDERAVGLGFLGVLRLLAAEQRVLVAVDDLQWLDLPSARALAFAGSRLGDICAGFLIALRAEERSRLAFAPERILPESVQLPVRGLPLEAIHQLLKARLGLVLTRPALRLVHEQAAGNPFFALELARAAAARPGAHQPGERLAVPSTVRELVGARLAEQPVATRRALLAVAALADPRLDLVGASIVGDAAAALGPAVEAEIVSVVGSRIRFTHPLLAAAAYEAAAPGERREIHAALATLVGEREEQVRHLALAADGPDAAVAAALDEAAALARSRGAPVAAAELLEEARELTPAGERAEARRRAVDAARCHFESGDSRRARALLEEVIAGLAAGRERANALIVLAPLRSYDDDIRAALALYEQAILESEGDRLVLGTAHEGIAGNLFRLRERFEEAAAHARQAVTIGEELGDPRIVAAALGSQLTAEAALGFAEARTTAVAAAAVVGTPTTRILQGAQFQVAVVQMWWEELDAAHAAFEQMNRRAAEIGDESSVPYVQVLLAQADCLRGRFVEASAHAAEAAGRAEQAGQETLHAYALALRGLAAAYRGEIEEARASTGWALELARSTSGRPAEQFATAALGLLELSLERAEETVGVLTPLVAFARGQRMSEPGLVRFVPDLVEALVACGRIADAEAHLDWYEGNAERLERVSAQGTAARCRGFLAAAGGDLQTALNAFERARALHERAPMPFDRARTLLALGSARRRANERRAARTTLIEARALFGSLGASVWEARAQAELGRIGGRAPSSGELTPVETRVAELAAAGRTNREVAASLFLSTRTVEGHLSRIYGKLGIRSRVELARRLELE